MAHHLLDALSEDPAERRRTQNRIAQRKWRQKRAAQRGRTVAVRPRTLRTLLQQGAIASNAPALDLHHASGSGQAADSSMALPELNFDDLGFLDLPDAGLGFASGAVPNSHYEPFVPGRGFSSMINTAPTSLNSIVTSNPTKSISQEYHSQSNKSLPHRVLGIASSHTVDRKPGDPEGWLGLLHIASQRGHSGVVQALLLRPETDPDERDSDGLSPLMHAIIEGHADTVAILLAGGARLSQGDNDGHTALHYAAWYKYKDVLGTLLDACGPDRREVNASSEVEWSPLHVAAVRGFEDGVLMLINAGADPTSKAPRCPHLFGRQCD